MVGQKKSKYTIFVKISKIWQKIQAQIVGGLNHIIKNYYKPLLKKAINHPFSALSFAAGVFVLTVGILALSLIHI